MCKLPLYRALFVIIQNQTNRSWLPAVLLHRQGDKVSHGAITQYKPYNSQVIFIYASSGLHYLRIISMISNLMLVTARIKNTEQNMSCYEQVIICFIVVGFYFLLPIQRKQRVNELEFMWVRFFAIFARLARKRIY